MPQFCFLNDQLLPESGGCISPIDLGLQRGYGCFDFFRIASGRPLFLQDHLDRFYRSAAALRLPIPYTREELTAILEEVRKANGLEEGGLRLTLTGGPSKDGYSIGTPTLLILANFFSMPSEAQWEKGLHLITRPHQRQLPHIKTTDYLMAILLQPEVKAAGADDLLYVSGGEVRECPRANLFIVSPSGSIVTPSEGILEGVTRKRILGVCGEERKTEVRPLRTEELFTAREAFITSSTKGVLPVTRIDGQPIGEARPGPVSRELARLLIP